MTPMTMYWQRCTRYVLNWASAGLLLCCAPVLAAIDVSSLSFEELLQVEVVSASKFSQKSSEAPAAVSTISAEEIRAHGWTTLKEAMAGLPGIYINDDRVYGFLGARGLLKPGDLNTRFLLMVDGEPLNDNVYEQAFFGDEFPLDLALVESIEYVPGSGSSIYGANAMFGVINVITRKTGNNRRAEVALRLDSQGRRETRATLEQPLGAGYVMVSWTGLSKSGRDLFYPETIAQGVLDQNGIATLDGRALGLDRTRNDKLFARYTQGGFSLSMLAVDRKHHPSSAPYGSLFSDPGVFARDGSTILATRYASKLAEGVEFSGRLSHGSVIYDAELPYWDGATSTRNLWLDHGEGRRWAGEARLTFSRWTAHTLIAGIEFRHDVRARQWAKYVDGVPDFDNDIPDRRKAIYVQDEWRFAPEWRLNAGIRLDQSELYGNHVSPRLGLIWQARSDLALKLLGGRAFRNPNAFEAAYGIDPVAASGTGAYLANPNLKAEVVTTRELVAEWRLTPASLLVTSLFDYRLAGMISQDATGSGDYQFNNVAPIRTQGLEASFRTLLGSDWHLGGSVSFQEAKWSNDVQVTNSPRWVGKLALRGPLIGEALTGAFELHALSSRDVSWGGMVYQLPTTSLANLTLTANRLAPGLEVQLRITNLLDKRISWPAGDDAAVPLVPGEGRTIALAVRYAL